MEIFYCVTLLRVGEPLKLDLALGGQALIEGVMIRSPNFVSCAVRTPEGRITTKLWPFTSLAKRQRFFALPLIRGVVNLIEMMVQGTKALNYSADEFAQEAGKEAKKMSATQQIFSLVIALVISLAFGLFLLKFVPLFITEQLRSRFPAIAANYLLFNFIDGLIRIAIFLGYIGLLSAFKSFRRIFAYHGAEHMCVHAYEKGVALDAPAVRTFSPRHPRCGTSFLVAVFIISIFVFTLIPRHPVLWINFAWRLLGIPLIAGLGYEVLKWSARHRSHPLVNILTVPGLLTQYITAKQPDDEQIEVAATAVTKALDAEGKR